MAGFYERIGIANHLQSNPTNKSANAYKPEATVVTEAAVDAVSTLDDIIKFLLANWQLTVVGAVALLILIKRL